MKILNNIRSPLFSKALRERFDIARFLLSLNFTLFSSFSQKSRLCAQSALFYIYLFMDKKGNYFRKEYI